MSVGSSGSPAKAIMYAFVANLGIALSKLAAAFYTGSGSMMAESIHSFADSGNQVLLFIGIRSADRPADDNHPLGYGKLSYFWSFIVAIVLFSLGGLYSIYEGWHKWNDPEPLNEVWVALLVLGGSIVLECFSLYGAMREINLMRGSKPFWRWLKQTRNAEIVVVLGEDIAAIFGLVLAFAFLSLAAFFDDPIYDAWGSMTIGAILILVALFLVNRIQGLLVGKSAEPDLRASLDELIESDPSIEKLFNTITIQFGSKVMLAAKIQMVDHLTLAIAIDHINTLESRLKQAHPEVGWCFFEPDLHD